MMVKKIADARRRFGALCARELMPIPPPNVALTGLAAELRERASAGKPIRIGLERIRIQHDQVSIRPHLYDCLLHLTEGLLATGLPVMLEGTFLKPEMRQKVAFLAEKSEARLLSIQVECRLALRESRNGRRSQSAHVPESYLRQAHHLAKEQIRQADFVFDTELHQPEGLAAFLLGAVGVMPFSSDRSQAPSAFQELVAKL